MVSQSEQTHERVALSHWTPTPGQRLCAADAMLASDIDSVSTRVQNQSDNQPVLCQNDPVALLQLIVPIKPQHFSENEYQNHADEYS